MNLKIAVCDDNKNDRENLKSTLVNYYIANDIELSVDLYASGKELLAHYKKSEDYQIILLDVEMPEASGIEIAQTIRSTIDRHAVIVFISNYPQYMQDSFRVHPFYYIMKPYTSEDIFQLMDSIIKEIESSRIIYSLISTEQGDVTINIRDVLYIEASDSRNSILSFHFSDYVLTTKGTIVHWQEQLAKYNFYQCCRGILLNLRHIHYFNKGSIVLDNGESVPVSRKLEHNYQNMEQQMKFQREKYVQLGSYYKSMRSILHDMKNHYFTITNYIENEEYDKLQDYMKDAIQKMENCYAGVNTGNLVIDAFMNHFKILSENEHITFSEDIAIAQDKVPLTDYDLCVVIGNLLDNAYNAVSQLTDKEKIVGNYHGVMQYKADEDFAVTIVIPVIENAVMPVQSATSM